MLTVGIDPGLTGAVAFLRNGEYVALFDIPTTLKGSGSVKQEVEPGGLKRMFLERLEGREDVAVLAYLGFYGVHEIV